MNAPSATSNARPPTATPPRRLATNSMSGCRVAPRRACRRRASTPVTVAPRAAAAAASVPRPQPTSRTRVPGPTRAASSSGSMASAVARAISASYVPARADHAVGLERLEGRGRVIRRTVAARRRALSARARSPPARSPPAHSPPGVRARCRQLPRCRPTSHRGRHRGEAAFVDRVAQLRHKALEVGEVVDREQAHRGLLLGAQEVVQVRAGVALLAGRAGAAFEQRLVGLAPAGLGDVDAPALLRVGHERHAVSADAGRHRAVERVDAELDAAHDLADAQQMPGAWPPAAPRSSTRRPGRWPCPRPASHRWRCHRGPRVPRPPGRRSGAGPRGAALVDAVDDLALGTVLRVQVQGRGRASGGCARSSARCTRGQRVERGALVEDQRDVQDPERALGPPSRSPGP